MTNQNGEDLLKQLLRYYPPPQDDPRTSKGVIATSHLKPSTELTNSLVSLYFQNFHPLLPVLHKNYFLNRLSDTKRPISPLLLLAICAIGSNYSDNPEARKHPNDPHTVGLNFYESAQGNLPKQCLGSEKRRKKKKYPCVSDFSFCILFLL